MGRDHHHYRMTDFFGFEREHSQSLLSKGSDRGPSMRSLRFALRYD